MSSRFSPGVSTVYCLCPATWLCDPPTRFALSHVLLPYLLASGPAPQTVYQYSLNPRLCQTLDVREQIRTQWGENRNLQDSLCTYLRLHHSLSWLPSLTPSLLEMSDFFSTHHCSSTILSIQFANLSFSNFERYAYCDIFCLFPPHITRPPSPLPWSLVKRIKLAKVS